MTSLRQIRSRLKSIHSTKQIMRAMQLVSGSKLKRAQGRLLQARSVLEFLNGLLERVLAAQQEHPARGRKRPTKQEHPLCIARDPSTRPSTRSGLAQPVRLRSGLNPERSRGTQDFAPQAKSVGLQNLPSALVLFTSDAGLCGSYNTNLIQLAESYLRRDSAQRTQIIYVGKKGYRYFTKRGYAAAESYLDLAGRPNITKADEIGRALMQRFLDGKVGSIQLLYSQFRSATSFKPTITQWLPITLRSQSTVHSPQIEYIFEPSPERVFDDLLPRWALATFRLVMLEAFTSEHSARMIAMKNATDNAEEILKSLTTQRNKIRQAAITKELAEIVGTAEALK